MAASVEIRIKTRPRIMADRTRSYWRRQIKETERVSGDEMGDRKDIEETQG